MVYSLFLDGAVISMWCCDIVSITWVSLCLWFNFSSDFFGGEAGFFGGEASSLPPPVDETLPMHAVFCSYYRIIIIIIIIIYVIVLVV